ncbi:MAG: hypothetical protein FD180_28 [Planctomycetota bacterium]|nr:MAG: hypothetical protein FD180_28 [Planctomycetota bacterium]
MKSPGHRTVQVAGAALYAGVSWATEYCESWGRTILLICSLLLCASTFGSRLLQGGAWGDFCRALAVFPFCLFLKYTWLGSLEVEPQPKQGAPNPSV